MDDPIQRHPTRAEQLDVLVSIIEDAAPANVLDLGCGTGYVANAVLERCASASLIGVDVSGEALAQAERGLQIHGSRFTTCEADLQHPDGISLDRTQFDCIYTCLTFHDLSDRAKQAVIAWAAGRLAPGGMFLLYDRLRLTARSLFGAQRSVWNRIERVHGRAMRQADSFDDYLADLGTGNTPASLSDYLRWLSEHGLESACLHLHGNIALFGAAHRAD